jgi:hypothetical protein
MRYLSGGPVRTLTTFGYDRPSSDNLTKTCQGPDSGWQGYHLLLAFAEGKDSSDTGFEMDCQQV